MQNAFLCLALLSLMVFVARMCRSADLSQGASENAAHAAALSKRLQTQGAATAEPRWEPRYKTTVSATAKILGVEDAETPCHIVNISGSGMRIKWSGHVPSVCQIQVRWGDHFFIGSMRNKSFQAGGSMIGLELDSCNYTRIPWQWRLPYFGAPPGAAKPARRPARPELIASCEQFLLESLVARRLEQKAKTHGTGIRG
jgi:hypothetical protein